MRPTSAVIGQNWLARVFNLKPAQRVLAFNASKSKSRKEVFKILCDWQPYGMEDVQLDKVESIISGRVSEKNCKCLFFFFFLSLQMRLAKTREKSSVSVQLSSVSSSTQSSNMAATQTSAWPASSNAKERRHRSTKLSTRWSP